MTRITEEEAQEAIQRANSEEESEEDSEEYSQRLLDLMRQIWEKVQREESE